MEHNGPATAISDMYFLGPPCSDSWVMLVSAFAGREHVLHAYEEAVKERYRFFSFGDAMCIL